MFYKDQFGNNFDLKFFRGEYQDGSIAVEVLGAEIPDKDTVAAEENYEPYVTLTVFLPNPGMTDETTAFIDTNNVPANLVTLLEKHNYIDALPYSQSSGYCVYPLYTFNDEFIKNMETFED